MVNKLQKMISITRKLLADWYLFRKFNMRF